MKIKLIKLAQELNSSISDIAKFLTENGYEVIEDANETLDDEIADFVRDNLVIKLSNAEGTIAGCKDCESHVNAPVYSKHDPIELKILAAASEKTKFIERIIGYTEFKWQYCLYRYIGTISKPVPFDAFDEVICGILLRKKVNFQELGNILGLHVDEDIAESQILVDAITSLQNDTVIEKEDDFYVLTEKGLEYAKKGSKLSVYERDFDIYIDKVGNIKKDTRKIFSNLRSEKIGQNIKDDDGALSIEQIREYAADQAPEVHFPANDFILQECKFKNISVRQASVWVVLLENFRDKTLRALVYDEESNQIVDSLSKALSTNEELIKELLDRMIAESKQTEFLMEFTSEDKSQTQIEEENLLIAHQEAYDIALKENDIRTAEQIKLQLRSEKRFFGSLEFEVELKRLFDNTKGDLWVISPWIGKKTRYRIPFFERYMKKGGRVFVAYSKPEKEDDIMADPKQLMRLQELERKYNNFYLFQLPVFHYKYVFLQNVDRPLFYSGSYNILSYFATPDNVRNEQMSKFDWAEEVQISIFQPIMVQFGMKYIEDAKQKMQKIISETPESISYSKINAFAALKFDKLLPFVGQGSEELDKSYKQLVDMQSEHVAILKKQFISSELKNLKLRISKLDNSSSGITERRKIYDTINELKILYPDIADKEQFKELQVMLKDSATNNINNMSFGFKKNKHR